MASYNEQPSGDLARFIENVPMVWSKKLSKWGIIPQSRIYSSKGFDKHLEDFRQFLKSKGNTGKYVKESVNSVEKVLDGCNFRKPADISPDALRNYLYLRRESERLSAHRSNGILAIFKTFCNWIKSSGRITSSPVNSVIPVNTKVDRRLVRRALDPAECASLIHAAENGKTFRGMTEEDRAVIYQCALGTGLRYSELKSLCRSDFSFTAKTPCVKVSAKDSKHRQDDILPLNDNLKDVLQGYFAERPALPKAKAFPFPASDCGSRMMKHDLKVAGLKYKTSAGTADFHALRHTFITNLAKSGIHPSVAQKLARHSDVNLLHNC